MAKTISLKVDADLEVDDVLAEISVHDIVDHFDKAGDLDELIECIGRDRVVEHFNIKEPE